MPKHEQPPSDLVSSYLDGLLVGEERDNFERQMQLDPALAEEVELQLRVDESIGRLGNPPEASPAFLEELASTDDESPVAAASRATPSSHHRRPAKQSLRRYALLTLAASVAWFVVAAQFLWSGDTDPHPVVFHQRPLTQLYQECVAEGFQPYWICDNETLFAATFERRQGVPLKLGDMPEDSRMVGLSYLAGISRRSTSLLAKVGNTPVVVFIDQSHRDWNPATGHFPDLGLSVTRVEKLGLVFYEVSPLEKLVVVDYLQVANE